MNEFEKESAAMDMKEEMMADAVEDVMEDEEEDEEAEGDKILKEVLDEIGVSLQQQVSGMGCCDCDCVRQLFQLGEAPTTELSSAVRNQRQAVVIGEGDGMTNTGGRSTGATAASGDLPDEDALQARLDALRKS
jgi:charged multivesicular body protein 2A